MRDVLDFKITIGQDKRKIVTYNQKVYTVRAFADKIGVDPSLIHLHHKGHPETYHIEVSKSVWKKANNVSKGRMVILNKNGNFELKKKATRNCLTGAPNWGNLNGKSRAYRLENIPSPTKYEQEELRKYTFKGVCTAPLL